MVSNSTKILCSTKNRVINSQRMRETAKNVIAQYGVKGLWRAIINKVKGRPLLEGFESAVSIVSASSNITFQPSSTNSASEDIGRLILRKQQEEFSPEDYARKIDCLMSKPLISVVMPMYNAPLKWIRAAVASLESQYYPYWELCVVDDGSKDKRCVSLIKQIANTESRIRFCAFPENRGISAASNFAVEMSSGQYIALMDDDDALSPDAFFWIAKAIDDNPQTDFIYTDECKVDDSGDDIYSHFFFKPDWSPEMMINFMYTGHLTVYSKDLFYRAGRFRSEYDFSQDYDLALRASLKARKIVHIERVLYFWRMTPTSAASGGKDYSIISNTNAVKDYFKRIEYPTRIYVGNTTRYISRQTSNNPKVSIVIPSDNRDHVKTTLKAITQSTSYPNYEIIFVVNSALAEEIEKSYAYYSDFVVVCRYDGVFNFSEKCNIGASSASGTVLIFYNDDALPYYKDWVEQLLNILFIPGVGGVSPAMLYEDSKSVQYGGTQISQHICGLFGPSFHLQDFLDTTRIVNSQIIRDVTALSGACMAVRKNLFFDLGEFDSVNTPNGHSDVDFSFRLAERGFRCVYTPYSALIHPGNGTWTMLGLRDKANLYIIKKWHDKMASDAYFTRSMRRYNLGKYDLPYDVFFPDVFQQGNETKGDILLICHEFSRTGAPVVLLETAKILMEAGYFVVVASPFDGPMRKDFLQIGVMVIIDNTLADYRWHSPNEVPKLISHSIKSIIHEFDLVICMTMVCHNIINCFNGTDVPIIWWLHEGLYSYKDNAKFMPHKLGSNITVRCGGLYAQQMLSRYKPNYKSDILLYGLKDKAGEFLGSEFTQGKTRFIFPGSFECRKNQKLLLAAIESLPDDIADRAEFIMIGSVFETSPDSIAIFHDMKAAAERIANLQVLLPIPYDQLMSLYETVDCIVVPSVDDPMPVVLTEGLMFSKIVLCSDTTGTAKYLDDGVNGFVFKSGNMIELREKISYIVKHQIEMDSIRNAGRKLFKQIFAEDTFSTALLTDVEQRIADSSR